MAKKKNRPNPPKKNDSSIPYVERLAAERKEKEEQELLSDERVQKKLEELENAQKDAEKKLSMHEGLPWKRKHRKIFYRLNDKEYLQAKDVLWMPYGHGSGGYVRYLA